MPGEGSLTGGLTDFLGQPLVIEFGGEGLKVPGTTGRKRGKTDNRTMLKRVEIPAILILTLLPLILNALPPAAPSEGRAPFAPPGLQALAPFIEGNPIIQGILAQLGLK